MKSLRKHVQAAVLFAVVLAANRAPVYSQNMSPRDAVVLTDKEAFALMPPELVAASGVRQAAWSPDGQYVILHREDTRITPEKMREMMGNTVQQPPGNNIISVWDRSERRLIDAWKQPIAFSHVHQLQWLPKSSLAIAKVSITIPPKKQGDPAEYHDGIIRISAATGSVKILTDSGAGSPPPQESVSPVEPLIVFYQSSPIWEDIQKADGTQFRRIKEWKTSLTGWRETGGMSQPIEAPSGYAVDMIQWTQDGTPILRCHESGIKPGEKPVSRLLSCNLKSRQFALLSAEQRVFSPPADNRPLRTKQVRNPVKEGDTVRQVPFVWLESVAESMQTRALVAANSDFGSLSPKSDAVLYVSHGAAWVTPLFKMSKEEFLAALEAAQRTVAMSNAKQLGLGLLMYAQDYDEKLPGSDGDLNGKIRPYVKNESLFDGFFYTYAGGPLSDIASPAETELGYVTGPGGKAIMYADGHVKWRKE